MWVAAFTSRASPAPETMVSLRSKYCAAGSWSHAQAPEQVRLAANRCRTDDASDFHGHMPQFLAEIGGAELTGKAGAAVDHVPIWALDIAAAGDVVAKFLLLLHLTHQEKVDVVGGYVIVQWTGQPLPRHARCDEMRRDDDHQIGLLLLVGGAPEQRTEHRHRSDPGKLLDVALVYRLQQAGNCEALAVAQFDCCARFALGERWDGEAGDLDRLARS